MVKKSLFVLIPLYTQRKNTLCGQNVEFFVIKPAGTENNHWASKGSEALDDWVGLISEIELSHLRFYIRGFFKKYPD